MVSHYTHCESVMSSGQHVAHVAVSPDRQLRSAGMESLAEWTRQLRGRYATMREIAALIGMSESGFVRGVKRGTLSVENLLDLARATDTHPSRMLRLAGKEKAADLIERLYGPGRDALTESQRTLLELWDRLPDEEARRSMLFTLRAIGNAAVHGTAPGSSSSTRRGARGSTRGPASARRS